MQLENFRHCNLLRGIFLKILSLFTIIMINFYQNAPILKGLFTNKYLL